MMMNDFLALSHSNTLAETPAKPAKKAEHAGQVCVCAGGEQVS